MGDQKPDNAVIGSGIAESSSRPPLNKQAVTVLRERLAATIDDVVIEDGPSYVVDEYTQCMPKSERRRK